MGMGLTISHSIAKHMVTALGDREPSPRCGVPLYSANRENSVDLHSVHSRERITSVVHNAK